MPDNFNKPSYSRKQQLYVESSKKRANQQPSSNKKNNKNNKLNNNNSSSKKSSKNSNYNDFSPKKPKKSKKPFLLFISVALFVALISTTVFGSYVYFSNSNDDVVSQNDSNKDTGFFVPKKENVNVLLIGLDNVSYHTDTMIVANLNTKDGSVELISIPRDTYAKLPQEVVDEVYATQENPIMPKSGEMKLTELITYTQDVDQGLIYLKDYVGSILNVEIDNYVAVDLESFSYLIDEMGGVYFDVPIRMYYNDNAQDLHIDLQPGYQLLDGDKAEQLIRFRKGSDGYPGYATGDLGRIEMQQDFLKAAINQFLSKENMLKALPTLVTTYYKYITTDINILDMPEYAQYALLADKNNITTYTLPNDYEYINGKSYALLREDEVKILSDKVFYDIEPAVVEDTIYDTTKDNSDYVVSVLNGSNTKGLAGKTAEMLTADGYTIETIGDYSDELQNTTRLFVKNEEDAQVLADYFDSYEVVYTPNQYEDIVVVLGIEETLKGK